MGRFDKIDDIVEIRIKLPRWMLEDMRERARRQNLENGVTEWILRAVSIQRAKEDLDLEGT